jgi:hypothetical protein
MRRPWAKALGALRHPTLQCPSGLGSRPSAAFRPGPTAPEASVEANHTWIVAHAASRHPLESRFALPLARNALPLVSNALPQARNALPLVSNALPQARNASSLVSNASPRASDALPRVSDALPRVSF